VDGAFVNVLTWAADQTEFWRKACELMEYLRLELVAIERPEPLAKRGPEECLDEEIARIAGAVRLNPDAIMHGPFHTWSGPIQ
jgi:hypothetical protein